MAFFAVSFRAAIEYFATLKGCAPFGTSTAFEVRLIRERDETTMTVRERVLLDFADVADVIHSGVRGLPKRADSHALRNTRTGSCGARCKPANAPQ